MTRCIAFVIGAVAGLFPLELWAQFGTISPAPALLVNPVSEAITNKGYRKVGVIPQFIVRDSGQETLQGALAPHGRLFADGIRDGLVASARGNYQVADSQRMREAFAGVSITDLDDPAKLRDVGQAAGGLDALVLGSVTDVSQTQAAADKAVKVKCEILGLADRSRTPVVDQPLRLSIAGLAYLGQSFELRRWDAGAFVTHDLQIRPWIDMFLPVEFTPSLNKGEYSITPWFTHPDLDPSCAFHVEVVVDDKPRPLTRIGQKVYTPVNYGEKYAIRVRNRSVKEAFVAIFVDGLNILGKKPEHPGNCRYWHLDPESAGQFDGWFTGGAGQYEREEFRISRASDGEASKQGFTKSLGQITAVFYTVGPPPPPPPPKPKPQFHGSGDSVQFNPMKEDISTEAGAKVQVQLAEMPRDRPGLILAAISIYYRTPARIDEMMQETGARQ